MTGKEKMVEFLTDAITQSGKHGYILTEVDGVRFFANDNYAEVSFELDNGFIIKKTIFRKDD